MYPNSVLVHVKVESHSVYLEMDENLENQTIWGFRLSCWNALFVLHMFINGKVVDANAAWNILRTKINLKY